MSGDSSKAAEGPPMLLVRGDAAPEEVAAIVAVLQARAAAAAAAAEAASKARPRSQWAAPERLVRRTPAPGPGAWRASALPH